MYKIPHIIHLPFGYDIKIKQLGTAAFKVQYNAVFGDSQSHDTAAFCIPDDQGATLVLNKNRSMSMKRDDLYHEFSHAIIEYGEYIKTVK